MKVVLITGAARRIGAAIATYFHAREYRVIVHYRHSKIEADALIALFNRARADSAVACFADLDDASHYPRLIQEAVKKWQRLDVLINNASTFTPTPVETATLAQWDFLMNSNLKAPFFLSQMAATHLQTTKGNIVNIIDVHAHHPMKNYPVYSIAKAGLHMLTKSLAMELAPAVRVNAVAPGNVIWPENENAYSSGQKESILEKTWLKKQVSPDSIAETCYFLTNQPDITGQMICVDAGKSE
ncbi:MAG: hypothetical protein A3I77_00890 [Gammaproteobacteria bacterium RIFCSPLOWO2_02_FULL_42_14]|nr:MAG: hypothetical protein A3B71_04680 [Gammaproteobacteria bacterium RIFCSPHIGHO2_02_FULL_42_43]OGT27478.1 MAG: hypothetical protein A2624_07260 [Gammaproteobacteria bacterium RIFCSPHIGHO2_01_FULL_42_8]OGT53158.1 MAG: hypothetical protein A3E54_08540 [Gammaproteobacteria bacterium RIFCSPHIGHO2_12_FULL_41_25]OGT60987.1 MAG: hypothetical protein A3I77_00890 [Gammaproteobacteria bacterium RIFCSPLOWO2_02_FULL_42_14]OGT85303.1 MAG: hypothetical protein A3G86_05525 [Gammaproteobacteria bacterium R